MKSDGWKLLEEKIWWRREVNFIPLSGPKGAAECRIAVHSRVLSHATMAWYDSSRLWLCLLLLPSSL